MSHNKNAAQVELWIANLLRGGVSLSLLLLAGGTMLSFVHHPDYISSPTALSHLTRPGAAFPHTLGELGIALGQGRGQGVVTLGLLALIATPILRVALSALIFWRERDRAFTLITLAVLGLLMLSLILGKASG